MSPGYKKTKKHSFKHSKRRDLQRSRKERVQNQIIRLTSLVQKTENHELKRIYVKRLRALAQKVQYPLPESVKLLFCRRCSEVGLKIRLRANKAPHIVYSCQNCGYIRRKFYKSPE